jgi:dihydroorotate dehydrogenase (fumarate)
MADLSVTYMGVKLKNPLVLGASNLVTKPDVIKQIEEAGIGAIVYRSLFEEQIQLENLQMDEELSEYENRNAEMTFCFLAWNMQDLKSICTMLKNWLKALMFRYLQV